MPTYLLTYLLTLQVMQVQSTARETSGAMRLGPPDSRFVVDDPLAQVIYVPANGSVAGVRRVPQPSRTDPLLPTSNSRTDSLVVLDATMCAQDPRRMPWWAASAAPTWSEVHLIGDQLGVTYTLPLGTNGSGAPRGWLACSLPLHALDWAFSGIGTVSR